MSCWFAHAIPWFTRPAPSSVAGISMPSALAVFRLMAGPMPLDVSVGSFASFQRCRLWVRFTPKNRHRQLDRPRRKSAPQPDSCTAANSIAHSITSSARARIVGGIVRPSDLEVFRLMTSWNFVGSSTGRSAGLVPFKILST
jgi:hypothetical protein